MPKLPSAIFSITAPNANKKGESKICISMTPEKFAELVLCLNRTNLNGDMLDSFESFLNANEQKYQAIKGLAKLISSKLIKNMLDMVDEAEAVINEADVEEANALASGPEPEPEIDSLSTTSESSKNSKVKITVHLPLKK
jgi:hypothetical protein